VNIDIAKLGRGMSARHFLASVIASSGLCVVSAHAQDPVTIYKENYQFCTSSLGREAGVETGWVGLKSGLPQGKWSNLKVFVNGSTTVGGPVNSKPLGLSPGYSFWFRPTYALSMITAEMSYDVSLLKQAGSIVSYDQRLSGVDAAGVANETHLILLIDNTWYISQQAARQAVAGGAWEPVQFEPSKLAYGTVPYITGLGAEAPTSYGASLPASGTVRAFGVFLGEVNGRVRVDNFKIATTAPVPSSVSTQVQSASVAACPATSPDRGGSGTPPPPPGSEDSPGNDNSDQSVDTFKPVDQGSGPTNSGGSGFVAPAFCPVKEQGVGLKVRIPRASRKSFVKAPKTFNQVSLRDQAIAQIVAARAMPLGALVNVRVADYDPTNGTLKVSLRQKAAPKAIRLPSAARQALDAYKASFLLPPNTTDPLFPAVNRSNGALDSTKTLCSRELKALVTKRARTARLAPRGIFVR
jgi:hypothetical protein